MSLTQEQQEKLDDLILWVTSRVDELMPTGQTQEAPTGYIDKELDTAATELLRAIRPELAYLAVKNGTGITPQAEDQSLIIPCPADYLRFIRVRIDGWKRPVDQLISPNSSVYRAQSYKLGVGDIHKPIAALIPFVTEGGKQAIQCFPKADETISSFVYVPRLKPYEMPEDLEDPMIWMAASRVLTIMRRHDIAPIAYQNAVQALTNLRVGLVGEDVPVAQQQTK